MPLPSVVSIKQRRRALDMTQKQLADLCSLSQSVIAKIERGIVDPSYSTASKIFETLERLESKRTAGDTFLSLTAKNVMTKKVFSVNPTDSISKARKLMTEHDISQLPVIDASARQVGSLTEAEALGQQEDAKQVKDVILDPFPIIHENTKVPTIRNILLSEPAVLVSSAKSGIIGIITKHDLISHLQGAAG